MYLLLSLIVIFIISYYFIPLITFVWVILIPFPIVFYGLKLAVFHYKGWDKNTKKDINIEIFATTAVMLLASWYVFFAL